MKKLSTIFAVCAFTLLLASPSMAAPATATGDQAAQVERLLPYLSYVAEGDGNKVVYMLCRAQCPRCAVTYNTVSGNPDFKQYQFRWVLQGGSDPGYYFPMEGKPRAGMKELYGNPRQIEPRTIDNPERLTDIAEHNSRISGEIDSLFSGSSNVKMTPVIIIKTQDGFEYGSMEDFMGNSTTTSFGKALPLAEGVDVDAVMRDVKLVGYEILALRTDVGAIAKDVREAEKLPGGRHGIVATKKDMPVRLFPRDDAPLEGRSILKGEGRVAKVKTKNGWIGIQIYRDPDAPLGYVREKDGKLMTR